MKRLLALITAFALACFSTGFAQAQSVPIPPAAPVSNLIGQVTLAVSNASNNVALPSSSQYSQAITVYNSGTTDAYFAQGGGAVAATTSSTLIKAGTAISVLVTGTNVAAITASSTTTLVIYQANGPVNFAGGGGSGGGGGGGAVTAVSGAYVDGAIVTLGTEGDPAYVSGNGTAIALLKGIFANTAGAIPAGTALIGKTGVDQTTPGTTNLISLSANASGTYKNLITCDSTAFYDASDNGKKTIVAGVSAKKIYVCGYIIGMGGTATNESLGSGTGTDCVTTFTGITPAWQMAANQRVGENSPFWNGLVTINTADNLCVNSSAGNAHQVAVLYTIQ